MTDHGEKGDLLEEAAMLFLEISENPEDPDLLEKRDRFLTRSEQARAAYAKVEQGWTVSGGRPPSRLRLVVPALLVFGVGLYLTAEPVRTYFLADLYTGTQTAQMRLASGDAAHLDAGSAIVDETHGNVRRVELLQGGAFFDVTTSGQSFVVSTDVADVTVRGTSFEVSLLADGIAVTVAKGQVDVTIDSATWALAAGAKLIWQEGGHVIEGEIDAVDVASWRGDQLVIEDLSIRQVADLLDRRIPGEVVVLGGSWADARVSGTFDLTDPEAALRALALNANAQVFSAIPFTSVLMRAN